MPLPLSTVRAARQLLERYLPATRLVPAPSLSRTPEQSVYLKLECELPTGSFKPRGALFALLTNLERRKIREVIASSTGNHGAAVAFAARTLGIPATIFLPENPNPVKRKNILDLGAKIVERGRDGSEAFEHASRYATSDEIYFLNDATDPDLLAGPATIALEILEQLPEVDVIYVPMGDTALIRGVASAAKQLRNGIEVIGVQAELAPSYALSWKQGRVVPTETCNTIADGLATRSPDAGNVQDIRQLVDEVLIVSDDQMRSAIRHLFLEERVVAEPAGAAAMAAWQADTHVRGRRAVLLVTGGNLSPDLRREILG